MNNKKAYNIYILIKAASHGLFMMAFTVGDLYRLTSAHLDPLQLVLVGTLLEISIFTFEIPTGIIADLYSRRLSVILGVFLIGIGFILEGSIPIFSFILISQIFWGIGLTFTSGALEAWLSDEIGEAYAGSAFLKGTQVSQIGGLAGITLSTIIGLYGVNLPIIVSGCLFIFLGITLISVMPESGFKPVPIQKRNTFKHMKITFKRGISMIHKRPSLGSILWIGLFFGLYSEGLDRLWVAHLVKNINLPYFDPVIWMGLIWGMSMLLTYAAVNLVQKFINMANIQLLIKGLMISSALILIFLVSFGLVNVLWIAICLYLAIDILRQLNEPLYTTWVNHKLDPSIRATIISMSSQMDAFGQIAGGPITGWIGRRYSIRAALITSSCLLSPVLYFFSKHIQSDSELS